MLTPGVLFQSHIAQKGIIMIDNSEKKRITADRDLRRACMDYEKINEHDRHTQSARRQMNHQPYQMDFRSHIMSRFERAE